MLNANGLTTIVHLFIRCIRHSVLRQHTSDLAQLHQCKFSPALVLVLVKPVQVSQVVVEGTKKSALAAL